MGQACAQQKPNVLQKTDALSPPVSFADDGKVLGPLENTLQQTEQEFSSQIFDSHSPTKKKFDFIQHYLKETDIQKSNGTFPLSQHCSLCAVNGFPG